MNTESASTLDESHFKILTFLELDKCGAESDL